MDLGRVIGNVVATQKVPNLDGVKLLIVQPVTPDGHDKGQPLVAVDGVGAGAGETVYWIAGREGSLVLDLAELGGVNPADAGIVAIVDDIDVQQPANPKRQKQ